jgi:single-strand DNA-binding protein
MLDRLEDLQARCGDKANTQARCIVEILASVEPHNERITPGGQSVATMGVATNRIWTDRAGAKQEAAEFHTVVLWGKLAETASAYLQKGSLVLVESRIETRSWEDKNSITRKVTEIIAQDLQLGPRPAAPSSSTPPEKPPLPAKRSISDDGDEGQGRHLTPAFGEDEEIKPEDIPF